MRMPKDGGLCLSGWVPSRAVFFEMVNSELLKRWLPRLFPRLPLPEEFFCEEHSLNAF